MDKGHNHQCSAFGQQSIHEQRFNRLWPSVMRFMALPCYERGEVLYEICKREGVDLPEEEEKPINVRTVNGSPLSELGLGGIRALREVLARRDDLTPEFSATLDCTEYLLHHGRRRPDHTAYLAAAEVLEKKRTHQVQTFVNEFMQLPLKDRQDIRHLVYWVEDKEEKAMLDSDDPLMVARDLQQRLDTLCWQGAMI